MLHAASRREVFFIRKCCLWTLNSPITGSASHGYEKVQKISDKGHGASEKNAHAPKNDPSKSFV